jgi:8-oxo-dGTP diphosphatase
MTNPAKAAYTYEWPKADITVDCVVFGVSQEGRLQVVLIRRAEDPFKDKLALPGGFIEFQKGETALEAARREMEEEAGTKVDYLEQLGTFDGPSRDPRGRTFSVAHFALVRKQDHAVAGGSDASEANWMDVSATLATGARGLAFDHFLILTTAVQRLQAKIRYAPIGFNLLPKTFTLPQLQSLYEAILFRPLDKRNFRKKVLAMGILDAVGIKKGRNRGRKAELYAFNKASYDRAIKHGLNFNI